MQKAMEALRKMRAKRLVHDAMSWWASSGTGWYSSAGFFVGVAAWCSPAMSSLIFSIDARARDSSLPLVLLLASRLEYRVGNP